MTDGIDSALAIFCVVLYPYRVGRANVGGTKLTLANMIHDVGQNETYTWKVQQTWP